MGAVFISHSSRDQKVARILCAALESRGFRCWLASRDIGAGENFQEAIVTAIRAAGVMVLVFTESANNSTEIKKELALASQHDLPVIPVRLEDVVPAAALAYELATRQWINLFEDWEHELKNLCMRVQHILAVKDGPSDAASPFDSRRGENRSNIETFLAEAAARPAKTTTPSRHRALSLWLGLVVAIAGGFQIAMLMVANATINSRQAILPGGEFAEMETGVAGLLTIVAAVLITRSGRRLRGFGLGLAMLLVLRNLIWIGVFVVIPPRGVQWVEMLGFVAWPAIISLVVLGLALWCACRIPPDLKPAFEQRRGLSLSLGIVLVLTGLVRLAAGLHLGIMQSVWIDRKPDLFFPVADALGLSLGMIVAGVLLVARRRDRASEGTALGTLVVAHDAPWVGLWLFVTLAKGSQLFPYSVTQRLMWPMLASLVVMIAMLATRFARRGT